MFKNWKTTLAGAAAIVAGISLVVNGQMEAGVASIVTGIGLLFAKDNNVTGGTVKQ